MSVRISSLLVFSYAGSGQEQGLPRSFPICLYDPYFPINCFVNRAEGIIRKKEAEKERKYELVHESNFNITCLCLIDIG
jgi:hypothetical protein